MAAGSKAVAVCREVQGVSWSMLVCKATLTAPRQHTTCFEGVHQSCSADITRPAASSNRLTVNAEWRYRRLHVSKVEANLLVSQARAQVKDRQLQAAIDAAWWTLDAPKPQV